MFDSSTRDKALASRKARIEAGATYRRDWLDAPTWDLEAKKRGIRLPAWWVAPTPGKLKLAHQTLDDRPFRDVYGCTAARLIELNPRTPLRAFVGQMLEQAEPVQQAAANENETR